MSDWHIVLATQHEYLADAEVPGAASIVRLFGHELQFTRSTSRSVFNLAFCHPFETWVPHIDVWQFVPSSYGDGDISLSIRREIEPIIVPAAVGPPKGEGATLDKELTAVVYKYHASNDR